MFSAKDRDIKLSRKLEQRCIFCLDLNSFFDTGQVIYKNVRLKSNINVIHNTFKYPT